MGMLKLTLRQIRKSLGRFLAIFAIVALGVGFFCGLRLTKTAMIHTLDVYTDTQNMYDYRLVCTMGFAQNDVETVRSESGVAQAEGSIWKDVVCSAGDDLGVAMHSMSLPEQVNLLEVEAGRLPQTSDECVLDGWHYDESMLGKTLTITQENDEDTLDAFKTHTFTIVGLVHSPLYINYERGSTKVGNGTLMGYFCILPEAYALDYYTDIYLTLSDAPGEVYSDTYNDAVASAEPAMTALSDRLAAGRDETVRLEAREELDEARQTLTEKTQELEDGKLDLSDGEQALADGWQSYQDGLQELEDGRQQASRELASARQKLIDGAAEIDAQQSLLEKKKTELKEGRKTLADGQKQLSEAWAQYDAGRAEFKSAYLAADEQLADAYGQLESAQQQIDDAQSEINRQKLQLALGVLTGQVTPEQLGAAIKQLDAAQQQVDEGQVQLDAGRSQLANQQMGAQNQIHDASMTLCDARKQLLEKQAELDEAMQQLLDGEQQLQDGQKQLDDARKQITSGWSSYYQAEKETEQKLLDGEQELLDARQELLDSEQELKDARQKLLDGERQLADAEEEILDGERALSELEPAEGYALDRDTNTGYVCFSSDSDIVQGVSRVFPMFFFLVAALVCITTMSRMVEEQRTQIGVLKALGYSDGAITASYLFYTASASILGCVAGIPAGAYFLPKIIWQGYNIMYGFSDILWAFDWPLAIGISSAYLVCALLVTWYACASELTLPAAELIRPKAPKAGKRILLERFPFLWNRVKFLHKVSIRNILRYKKRMLMMTIGIGGCTALLLTGFGIRDSIQNVMQYQFGEISVYDASVHFSGAMDEDARAAFRAAYPDEMDGCRFFAQQNLTCEANGKSKSANVTVIEGDAPEGYFDLHLDGEPVAYPEYGECALSEALADALGVSTGGELTVYDSDHHPTHLRVSGIFENYLSSFVYLTESTWRDQMHSEPAYQDAWLLLSDSLEGHAAAAAISDDADVMSMSINLDTSERINTMLGSMDYIVLTVILFAGALAFIVLYNLTNINITERAREIATVKVLGFYDPETDMYVFRENFVLTLLGVVVGLPMGVGLHAYVMAQIKLDLISFDVRIAPWSFVFSALLTLLFSVLVSLILRLKIRRIDMAQALKSIE